MGNLSIVTKRGSKKIALQMGKKEDGTMAVSTIMR